MDYSKMSDMEINQAVGKIVSRDGMSIIASDGSAVVHKYSDVGDFKGVCLGWVAFDPCNNPVDAWPIILDMKIGLKPVRWEEWRAEGDDSCGFVSYTSCNKNPLRAAMVVFLKIKEGEE